MPDPANWLILLGLWGMGMAFMVALALWLETR